MKMVHVIQNTIRKTKSLSVADDEKVLSVAANYSVCVAISANLSGYDDSKKYD